MAVAVLVDFVRDVAHGSRAFDGMIGFGTTKIPQQLAKALATHSTIFQCSKLDGEASGRSKCMVI